MKKAGWKRIILLKMLLLCGIGLSACTGTKESGNPAQETEQNPIPTPLSEKPEQAESEAASQETTESEAANQETTESEAAIWETTGSDASTRVPWKVNICPDMPQPFFDVMKQYEQFMNADNQNLNDDSVQAKFWDGEWKYLYIELCGSLSSAIDRDTLTDFQYTLTDITGDGFPEMILAYGEVPEVIYHYSETNGIGMECWSSYFKMTIYENGIVEYVSGGAYSSTTYLEFQEEVESWVVLDRIAVSDTWDAVNQKMNDTEYFMGEWGGDGLLTEKISEEEYRQIQEKYVAEPMKFEWMPLVCENEPYIEAYKDFLLYADIDKEADFPIWGYYLFDLDFDNIPELGVLHDSLGSLGGYFTLYRFDGNEIVRILYTDHEPVRISNYTQILADYENQKIYLLKEMYLLSGNGNGLYGYLREIIEQDQVPYVHNILNLTVQHQGCDWKKHLEQRYQDEDGYLSDKELEECLFTEYYLEDEWKEISSEKYLTLKREIIPEENDFVDVRRYENLHILGSKSDLITDEAEYKNAQFTEEEIDSLFMEWKKYLLKNTP